MTAVLARLRMPAATRTSVAIWTPLSLYAAGVAAGLVASSFVTYPTNEGSAYYVSVAGNLATGRGLVIDTIWSYATPPLVLPRPAFELWQPMASLIAALPMALLGSSYAAAQLGGVLVGAAIGPLAWAITAEAAPALGTPASRVSHLSAGAGVVAALLAPFLLAVAVPESTLPFLVFGTLACWLAPRALRSGGWAALLLGGALGLAYLSRHEAVYIAAIFLAGAVVGRRDWSQLARRLAPVIVGGILVVGPWLMRNLGAFGTPLPGQAIDNALLTRNEQIFAYTDRPTLAAFLDQGPAVIVGHIVTALVHNIVDVLLLPAVPVSLIGLIGVAYFVRRGGLGGTALGYLLASGVATLAITSLVFPVASMWGTFLHAAGPFLVGLVVVAVLVSDRVVDAVRRVRGWQRANAWLAPLALALLVAPMSLFQLLALGSGRQIEQRYSALAAVVAAQPEVGADPNRAVIITDKPMWLSEASGASTLALPDEPVESTLALARRFDASLVVVVEGRDRFAGSLGSSPSASCLIQRHVPAGPAEDTLLFAISESCR